MDFIDTLTNEALAHDFYCECVVCRAASGDKDAMKQCEAAYSRARSQSKEEYETLVTETTVQEQS